MANARLTGAVDEVVHETFQMRAERLGLTQGDALQEAVEIWNVVPEELREEAVERMVPLGVIVQERLLGRRVPVGFGSAAMTDETTEGAIAARRARQPRG